MQYNEKQVQIMEVAERLFADKGFAGTSVRDIAEAAGVNLAMISYYFGSKEKLMESMFHYRSSFVRLQLESILHDADLASFQKVEKLIDNYIERFFQKQCFHKVMMREQLANAEGTISDQIFEMKQTNQNLIKQIISEGQKRGEFKKNIDTSFLMMTLVGTVSQLLVTQQFYRKSHNLESLPQDEFEKLIKKKVSNYLKNIFKSILVYEG